jgi:cell division protein FtsB
METQFQSASRKAELRDKIRALEAERNNLETEIILLKEKVEVKELEAYTVSLENEVGTLRVEKTLLEERATLAAPYNAFADGEGTPSISSLETNPAEQEFSNNEGIVQPISSETSSNAQ